MRVEFINGVQCAKCGKIVCPTILTSELCQGCGAKILSINMSRKTYDCEGQGRPVTVKVTHKLFRDIYEVVEP